MAIMDYLTGEAFRGDGDDRAEDELDEAIAGFKDVPLPNLQDVELESAPWLQDLEASTIEGVDPLTAERAQYYGVDGSKFSDIEGDPRLKEHQMSALASLSELADNGGMNDMDRANMARMQSQAATADRGRREAILSNNAARGMGGSGMELLAQLDSSQAATDRDAQAGEVAGQASRTVREFLAHAAKESGSVVAAGHARFIGEWAAHCNRLAP